MKESKLKNGKDIDNLQQAPFVRKYDPADQEETEGERLTIRINKDERARIEYLKEILNYSSDGTVIKLGLILFQNVIRNTLSEDLTRKISSQIRRKPQK